MLDQKGLWTELAEHLCPYATEKDKASLLLQGDAAYSRRSWSIQIGKGLGREGCNSAEGFLHAKWSQHPYLGTPGWRRNGEEVWWGGAEQLLGILNGTGHKSKGTGGAQLHWILNAHVHSKHDTNMTPDHPPKG